MGSRKSARLQRRSRRIWVLGSRPDSGSQECPEAIKVGRICSQCFSLAEGSLGDSVENYLYSATKQANEAVQDQLAGLSITRFINAFLGLGAILCFITCAGHIAAETVNGCCLYLYMGLIVLLIMVEGGVVADIFLNRDWKEDFPEDPSGAFHQFSKFIESNFNICKWIGLSVVCVQGLSVLLAMLLKALGPHSQRHYDSDEEYDISRVALLQDARLQSPYVVGEPIYRAKQ